MLDLEQLRRDDAELERLLAELDQEDDAFNRHELLAIPAIAKAFDQVKH